MKILVTGGAGFIGSHLVTELSKSAQIHRIVVLDDFSHGAEKNLLEVQSSPKVEIVEGSINNGALLAKITRNVDHVYHLAALTNVPESFLDPKRFHEVNVQGTLSVLEAAREAGAQKVIFSSTAAVYGDLASVPNREDLPASPQSPYGSNKIACEQHLEFYRTQYGLSTVSLRYFNVYGPRQNPNSSYAAAIPKFIERALEGREIDIFGDGSQKRDFLSVKDVVSANILAAESAGASGIYNVGSGRPRTVLEVARLIQYLAHSSGGYKFHPTRVGDIKNSWADIGKLSLLGFMPRNFEAELRETIAWFKSSVLADLST